MHKSGTTVIRTKDVIIVAEVTRIIVLMVLRIFTVDQEVTSYLLVDLGVIVVIFTEVIVKESQIA